MSLNDIYYNGMNSISTTFKFYFEDSIYNEKINEDYDINNPIHLEIKDIYRKDILGNINEWNIPNENEVDVNSNNALDNILPNRIKKKLGRKRKNSSEVGNHTRNNMDNMIRKIKVILKEAILKFINSKLEEMFQQKYKITIEGKEYKIKLLNISQEKVKNTNVEFNRKLFNETIRDFLSEKICKNFTKYPKDLNKILIETFYEIEIGDKITCILDKTFLECLRYFRMDDDIFNTPEYSCLKGLEKDFLNLRQNLSIKNYDEAYINKLIGLIKNFEKVYENKKSRKPRKQKFKNF